MLRNAWGGLWSGGGVVMLRFLALAHIVDATQRMGGVVVGWWGCDVNVPCTCTHCRCYATHGGGCGRVVGL